MSGFYEEINGICRLKIPFDKIYTSVFLIEQYETPILIDCATTSEDVDKYIVPSLKAYGYEFSDIGVLILTHRHRDHAGGMDQVLSLAPNIKVVKKIGRIFDRLFMYPMSGHTKNCVGVLDERSHTLICGDGLQGAGVDRFRCHVEDVDAYQETIDRIKNDNRIENLLFSHAYEPWNVDRMVGREHVNQCLSLCKKYVSGGIK